jgi:hypothetical protein
MKKIKIAFPIEQDEEGFPPFDVEDLWGVETDYPLHFRIDSIPFFAKQVAVGDVVRVKESDGNYRFDRVITKSKNSLIRVIVYKGSDGEQIRRNLAGLGCSTEAFKDQPIVAVDVPAPTDLTRVQEYLAELERTDVASYEEPILRHPMRD